MPRLVLLADDDDALRAVFARVLEDGGFEVVTAADGAEACERAAARKPDLVLMDLNMPVLDGLGATARLKADPATAAIPVLAFTSAAMPHEVQLGLEAGCDGYIVKPVEPNELVGRLREWLGEG